MGNFSISHYAGIRIERGWLELRYILDMAEIPTFQEMQDTGIVPKSDDPRVAAYLIQRAEVLKAGLALSLNGRPLALETISEDVIFPPGAGGLPTMKVGVVYRAPLPVATGACTLVYSDGNFPERAGWKEVVSTVGPGLGLLASSAASVSRSQELANYPTDLINSPPQDLSARVEFAVPAAPAPEARGGTFSAPRVAFSARAKAAARPISPGSHPASGAPIPSAQTDRQTVSPPPAGATALEANHQQTPRNRFTELITSSRWGGWFLLTAALIAAALGGLHGLEPGHGKTIVAAYLVGSQGTAAHALLLGLVVTATHTAGVYALGLVTLYASKYIVPEHLYPWLGALSGLAIAGLGLFMLRRRYQHGHHHHHTHHHPEPSRQHAHEHGRSGGHVHDHPHEHFHAHGPEHGEEGGSAGEGSVSYRQLVALGVTGGIIPCPAALVVLLSAVSLHRVALGLYLIVAFSMGLAAVLISIGLVTVYARRLLARLPTDGPLIRRWLPLTSAAVITCLGVAIAARALMTAGILGVRF